MRTLDRVGKRACNLGFDRVSPGALDAVGYFADQNRGFDLLLYEGSKRIKTKYLVLTAGDQNDGLGLRAQCLVHCIEVGRLGIVYLGDAAEFARKIAPVRTRLISRTRQQHLLDR